MIDDAEFIFSTGEAQNFVNLWRGFQFWSSLKNAMLQIFWASPIPIKKHALGLLALSSERDFKTYFLHPTKYGLSIKAEI